VVVLAGPPLLAVETTFMLATVEVGTTLGETDNRSTGDKLGAIVPTHRNLGAELLFTMTGALEAGVAGGVKLSLTRLLGRLRVAGSRM